MDLPIENKWAEIHFPKTWKTIHAVTETFTQRRSECKFTHAKCIFLSLYITNEIPFFLPNLICVNYFSFFFLYYKNGFRLFWRVNFGQSLSRAKTYLYPRTSILLLYYFSIKKYKTFSVLIYSYINTSGNWKNEKLCGIPTLTQFRVFPIFTSVDITIYQHGKCFIFFL